MKVSKFKTINCFTNIRGSISKTNHNQFVLINRKYEITFKETQMIINKIISFKRRSFLYIASVGISSFIFISCSNDSKSKSPPPPQRKIDQPDPKQNTDFTENVKSEDCIFLSPYDDLQSQLRDNIKTGEAACVKKIIELGGDVNKPLKQFGSGTPTLPIFLALEDSSLFFIKSKYKEFSIIKILVEAGAKLSVKNNDGESPLFLSLKLSTIVNDYPLVPSYLIYSGKAPLDETDSSGNTPLMITILNKNIILSKQLIYKGVNLNFKSNVGKVAIQMALETKNEEIADLLIDKKADLSILDDKKNSLLHLAIENKLINLSLKLVPLLKGTLGNVNKYNKSPFYLAVEQQQISVLQALLSQGQDQIDVEQIASIESPLHLALMLHNIEISQLLIDQIKNPNLKNKNGFPLLFYSLIYENYEIAEKLVLKNADLIFKDTEGNSYLHIAVEKKLHNLIKLLLDRNISIDALNSSNLSPLFYAIQNSDFDAFQILVNKGSNINLNVPQGTLLLFAIESKSHPDIISYLISKASNINSLNHDGSNALLLAIKNGNSDQVEMLLSRGADPNVQNKQMQTPLSLAVEKNNHTLASQLINKGAKINYRNQEGENLIHLASSSAMIDVLHNAGVAIDEKNNDGETPLSKSVNYGNLGLVRHLVSLGANVKWMDKEKSTLIHRASLQSHNAILEYLISLSLDVNSKNTYGETPLFLARSINIIDQLIRAGAQVNAINKLGDSVLSSIITNFEPSFPNNEDELIEKFLQYGANPNVKNSLGIYLLHHVVSLKYSNLHRLDSSKYFPSYNANHLLVKLLESPTLILDQKDENDETVLHKVDTPEEVDLLIKAGASLNPLNRNKKETPLKKKQGEFANYQSIKAKLEIDIAENKKNLEDAINRQDNNNIKRLRELIKNLELDLVIIDGEILTMRLLIQSLQQHGAQSSN